jgi:peptidoglycan/LPS O-acetylase OafA/YrhL
MRSQGVRIVVVVAALAAVVAFVPQGADTADFLAAVITIAFSIMFVLVGVRLYRMFRSDIYGLGDPHRALLYGSIAVAVWAMAARTRLFDTGLGTFAWFVLVGGASFGLYAVWRQYRAYRL